MSTYKVVRWGLIAISVSYCAPVLSDPGHDNFRSSDHYKVDDVTYTREEEAQAVLEAKEKRIGMNPIQALAASIGDPHLLGQWEEQFDLQVVPIHAALMSNGKVLAYDSINDLPAQDNPVHNTTRAIVWDPVTKIQERWDNTTGFNLFYSGLSNLPSGRVFVAGGNLNSALRGIDKTHVFNPSNNTWTIEGTMRQARWYPSVTPLANGEQLITGGGPATPEVRQTNKVLRALTGASKTLFARREYPWLQTAPNGKAFYIGPLNRLGFVTTSATGKWQNKGTRDGIYRDRGSFAMFDIGRILVAGGGFNNPRAVVIDLNAGVIRTDTDPMNFERRHHNLTLLADGSVLATGGYQNSSEEFIDLTNAVFAAELWDPATGKWSILAEMAVARMYHSTALLLPDGRVWSAGGGLCGPCQKVGYLQKNAEVFSPPYLFKEDGSGEAPRPLINSAPSAVVYDQLFGVTTAEALSIEGVAMVALGAVTHSTNMAQRYVPLDFSSGPGKLDVRAPANGNIAPPGYYLLFILDSDGVPSVAKIVKISA